jgi:hypothetical protein
MQAAHSIQTGLELGNDVESYKRLQVVAILDDGKGQETGIIHRFYTLQGSRLHTSCPQDEITISTTGGHSAHVKLIEARANSVVLNYDVNMRSNFPFLFGNTTLKSIQNIEISYAEQHSSGILETDYVHDRDQEKPVDLQLTIVATLRTLEKKIAASAQTNKTDTN